jgi:N-methylhydantoinase B
MAGDRGCPDLHNANGVYPDGTPWISAAQVGGEVGPFGANAHGDADSNMLSYQANGLGTAVEAIESGAPVVVLRHEIVPDTAGAGTHRGGAALMRDSLWLQPAEHHLMSIRYKRPSGFGVEGGGTGATGGIWIWEPAPEGEARVPGAGRDSYRDATPVAGMLDPETNEPSREGRYLYPYRVPSWHTATHAVLRYVNNGGGGWGGAFSRDPELVKRDVRDGYVTVEGAARDYGVAVVGDPENDPEGLVVDEAETARLRGRS